jgi:hypothetical protein
MLRQKKLLRQKYWPDNCPKIIVVQTNQKPLKCGFYTHLRHLRQTSDSAQKAMPRFSEIPFENVISYHSATCRTKLPVYQV